MCYKIEKTKMRGWYSIQRQAVRGDFVRLPYLFSQEAATRLSRMADVEAKHRAPKAPTYEWWKRATKTLWLGGGVMTDGGW